MNIPAFNSITCKVKIWQVILLLLSFYNIILAQNIKNIQGYVFDNKNTPIKGAEIILSSNNHIGTITNSYGFFNLILNNYQKSKDSLLIVHIAYLTQKISLENFKNSPIKIYLNAKEYKLGDISIEFNKSLSSEFSTKTISQLEIFLDPNSNADALIAINSLPMSTNTDESANPVLRGSSVERTRIFLNNIPIYKPTKGNQINNNVGSFSVFNSGIIENVEIFASNPPLYLGNVSGGAIDIKTLNKGKNLKNINITFAGGGFFLSEKVYKKNFVQLFANYTSLDLLKSVNEISLDRVNNYINYNFGINSKLVFNDNSNLKLFFQIDNESGDYKSNIYSYNGNFTSKVINNINIINYDLMFGKNYLTLDNGFNYSKEAYKFGNMDLINEDKFFFSALNLEHFFSNKWSLRSGLTFENINVKFNGIIPMFYYSLYPGTPRLQIRENMSINLLDIYIFGKYKPVKNLVSSFGIRKNFALDNNSSFLSFQGNLKYITQNKKNTFLFAFGKYHSFRFPNSTSMKFELLKSNQYTFEYNLYSQILNFLFSFYYKVEDGIGNILDTPFFVSQKKITGIELYLKKNFGDYISLSLSNIYLKSELKINDSYFYSPDNLNYFIKFSFSYDIPNIALLALTYSARPGRFYTPIKSTNYNADWDIYEPVFSNNINSENYNSYNLININISRSFKLGKSTSSTLFFGIKNLLDSKNERNVIYSKNYKNNKFEYYTRRTFFLGGVFNF